MFVILLEPIKIVNPPMVVVFVNMDMKEMIVAIVCKDSLWLLEQMDLSILLQGKGLFVQVILV